MRIAIFNQKGGVGKTTTTLNLGAALQRDHDFPTLIDLDPQGHLTSVFSDNAASTAKSLFAFFQGQASLAELAQPWPGVGEIIASHQQLIKVDSIFGKGPEALNKLRVGTEALEALWALQDTHSDDNNNTASAETNASAPPTAAVPANAAAANLKTNPATPTAGKHGKRHILIDCCPYIGVLALNAIFACERLIIPVSTDYLSLQAAANISRTLQVLEPVLKRRVERRYLLTRFDRRRKMSTDVHNKLIANYGDDVLTTTIVENVAVAESPAVHQDVFRHNASSIGAQCYRNLLSELRRRGDL